MKLYIYEHCPFCIRVRMIFGIKNIPVDLIVLMNNDEYTPKYMIGKKIVPILMKQDGSYMSESLDIISYIDSLDNKSCIIGIPRLSVTTWFQNVNSYVYKLLMPYLSTPLFSEFSTLEARKYFINKKESTYGKFSDLKKNRLVFIQDINYDLYKLGSLIIYSNAINGELSFNDFQIFPLLHLLHLIPEIEYPLCVQRYYSYIVQQTKISSLFIGEDQSS
ncbi:glutaredoxin 2 [Candidatus Erwinia haradaeae]|uniref:Glutaredoxin 2 n=1 Tax=Candidatus Erwinia haradaeae TaxID=1922217 RepID=A0A803GCC6_9GAMM|nr:glutaredoxin 2 [Candidatus Erwinia haradaeae]VFP87687.1 Glutaredoxin 2 [Candidatus Erwinia haradaeae]